MESGRNRNSLADIEEQLSAVFDANPAAVKNAEGLSVIPGNELPAVLAELSSQYGVVLMSPEEEQTMKELLIANPGIEVTPNQLLLLVAARTGSDSASSSLAPPPQDDPRSGSSSGASSPDTELKARGEGTPSRPRPPRSSSSMSSHGASTPNAATRTAPVSPFDSQLRQRSVPLSSAAPSAWTRKPLPASRRRRSDAGSASGNRSSSDNESSPAISRSSRRRSNPVSPHSESNPNLPFPPSSFSSAMSESGISTVHRSQSFDQSLSRTLVDDFPKRTLKSKTSPQNPVIQFSSGSDSDTDPEGIDEESTHRYVRQALSSDASLAPQDVVEALQKANAELSRKAAESERRMQNRLAERETEIAELEAQLDDLKTELSSSRREEKELRAKERGNMTQLASFESEIQKLTKSLEHHKSQYTNMQKQYQEQCTETERVRNMLRRKEQEIKDADDRAFMHEGEAQKWVREREALEQSIESLEAELTITRQATNELDEQKQENLLLKETIDRMRFDLDALRAGMTSNVQGQPQGQGTLSRSLANEIKAGFERREREEQEREQEEQAAEEELIVEDAEGSEDGYIETTITTSRKRINRSKPIVRLHEGMMREYADAEAQHDPSHFVASSATQHDPSLFVSSMGVQHDQAAFTSTCAVQYDREMCTSSEGVQYDRGMFTAGVEVQYDAKLFTSSEGVQHQSADFSTQTGVQYDAKEFITTAGVQHDVAIGSTVAEVQTEERKVMGVGTDPIEAQVKVETEDVKLETEPEIKPERTMCEVEIQTEEVAPPIPSPISVPTPGPSELPPPYPQSARDTEAGVLKKWHAGLAERAQSPVPSQAREEWAALKRSVGVECGVIDHIIEGKEPLELVEGEVIEGETEWVRVPVRGRRGLFNVYNTYIVRRRGDGWWTSVLTQAAVGLGFWVVVAGIWGPRFAQFDVPTYTDRATWSAYNNYAGAFGEGLIGRSVDNPIWVAIERLVVGAAVRVGPGLPT